jgi:hypothetical protein
MITGYCGWVRTTGRWQPVLTDADHDRCLTRLMEHAERLPDRQRDVLVIRQGEDPTADQRGTSGWRRTRSTSAPRTT